MMAGYLCIIAAALWTRQNVALSYGTAGEVGTTLRVEPVSPVSASVLDGDASVLVQTLLSSSARTRQRADTGTRPTQSGVGDQGGEHMQEPSVELPTSSGGDKKDADAALNQDVRTKHLWSSWSSGVITSSSHLAASLSLHSGISTKLHEMNIGWFDQPQPFLSGYFALYCVGTVFSGICIGMNGFGGVLIAPMLLWLGVDVQIAFSTALISFVVSGAIGTVQYAKKGFVCWRNIRIITVGVLPGTVLGACMLPNIPKEIPEGIIATVAMYSGAATIVTELQVRWAIKAEATATDAVEDADQTANDADNSRPATFSFAAGTQRPVLYRFEGWAAVKLAILGIIVGYGSVLSATGGPFLLTPLAYVIYPEWPPAQISAVGQFTSMVVSAGSAPPFFASGKVDLGLLLTTSIGKAIGVPIGVIIATRIDGNSFKLIAAVLLIAIASYMFTSQW